MQAMESSIPASFHAPRGKAKVHGHTKSVGAKLGSSAKKQASQAAEASRRTADPAYTAIMTARSIGEKIGRIFS